MALFGKKAKDGVSDSSLADSSAEDGGAGGVAVAEAPVSGKKGKAARAPKVAKAKAVKNGVAVGLNIGNQFIKAVEVTNKNGELTVTAMGAVPTPPESFTNGNVLSVSALSGAIRELWKGAGIKSKVAITSVAGTGALVVRVIEVPKMSDGELGDNMKVDADRYIPFPPSEVVMDFKALRELPTDPDAPNMEVLLAAAQREIIDLHVQVVQKAKLDPRAIDVEPIAAARALQMERRTDGGNLIDYNEVTAVVNLGATGTEISILRGDVLVFTRVVPGGGNQITQAIAEGMGLPFADAERVKIEGADAIAPAGYNAGASDAGEFNFGDDFGGGSDLNSAFDDISANPTATSDDPFDLDFFNQTPKDEPGAGHAQKEGEPGQGAPADFSFTDFNFDAPAPSQPAPAPAPETTAPEPAPTTPISFNFGFDDLNDEDLPSVAAPEAPPVASRGDNATSKLEESSPSSAPVVSASEFAASAPVGSAFDFDNFDLPTAAAESSESTGAAVGSRPAPVSTSASSTFGFESSPPVSSSGPTSPVNFEMEESSAPAATPLSLQGDGASSAPQQQTNTPSEATTAPFDFAAAEPVSTAPTQTAPTATSPSDSAASSDEFDLDAIFGASTANPAASSGVGPAATSTEEVPIEEFGGFGAPPVAAASTSPSSTGDFDLSGIDTGTGDDYGAGFGDSNDFSDFGAGLGDASSDAAALYGLVAPALGELASEVRRSLEFHLGRYPDATISRLVLLGGGARLKNLDVFLTQMIGVPTAVANPFTHIAVQTPRLAPGYASENGPLCVVALGLALRDFVD